MGIARVLNVGFLGTLAGFLAMGCEDNNLGKAQKRTAVTWCNYYDGVCGKWEHVEQTVEATTDLKTADGREIKRGDKHTVRFPKCVESGVKPLCDEKVGCEVCFDPNLGVDRPEICRRAMGRFCPWGGCDSMINSSDYHEPPVQLGKCTNGLLTMPTTVRGKSEKTASGLVVEDVGVPMDPAGWRREMVADPPPGWGYVNVRVDNAFDSAAFNRQAIGDGRVALIPQACWSSPEGEECLVAVKEFTVRVADISGRGHQLTNIEITNELPFEIHVKGDASFTSSTAAEMFARFDDNGKPRVANLRADRPFSGTMKYGEGGFWIHGTFSHTLNGAGPFGTDVHLTFYINTTMFSPDHDGDGILDHLDRCPYTPGLGCLGPILDPDDETPFPSPPKRIR